MPWVLTPFTLFNVWNQNAKKVIVCVTPPRDSFSRDCAYSYDVWQLEVLYDNCVTSN